MQAIIFDCDGVLIDSESILLRTERAFLKTHGLHYTEAAYKDRFLGVSGCRFKELLATDYKKATGKDITEELSVALKKHAFDSLFAELTAIDGIETMLQSISHIPLAVASNSFSTTLSRKMAHVNLDKYFNTHLYSRDNVKNPKPAPDMYLLAAERLGHAPQDCLVVEDSPLGASAAVSAGMMVIGFAGGGHCDQKQIDELFDVGAYDVVNHANDLSVLLNGLYKKAA